MLPEFDREGNLPPGIYVATLESVVSRFGTGSPEREVQARELEDFVQWSRNAGILRMVVDGSFVTSRVSPNDVDVVILPPAGFPLSGALEETERLWPFIHVIVATDQADLEKWARVDFSTDRKGVIRGVVEFVL